jgi:uncharacterized protein YpmB
MTNRRQAGESDSLELLLDTICNIFGGIIFIAMLVSILTSYTSSALKTQVQEEQSALEQVTQSAQLQSLSQQVQALRQGLDAAERFETTDPGIDELKTQAERDEALRRLAERKAKEAQARADAAAALEEIEKSMAGIDEKSEAYAQWLKEHKEKIVEPIEKLQTQAGLKDVRLKQLEFELKDLKSARQLQGRLPVEQATTKSEVTIALHWGRMFVFAAQMPPHLQRLYAGQVTIEQLALRRFAAVQDRKLGNIVPEGELPKEIKPLLAEFPPSTHYIHLMVYSDSVTAYRTMRTLLLEAGYQYQVSFIDGDGPIYFRVTSQGSVQ